MSVTVDLEIEVAGVADVAAQVTTPQSRVDVGTDPVTVPFAVTNPLDKPVTFTDLRATFEGEGDLLIALQSTAMQLGPKARGQNAVIIEPNEPLLEGRGGVVKITGRSE